MSKEQELPRMKPEKSSFIKSILTGRRTVKGHVCRKK